MIDLHVHTTASDGTFTPSDVVLLAKKAGLAAMAITDTVRKMFIRDEDVIMTEQHSTTFLLAWRAKNASPLEKTAALETIVDAAPQREYNAEPHCYLT